MALDDLLKGLAVLESGVSSAARNNIIQQSREKLKEVNQIENQEERLLQQTNLSNDLAAQLAAMDATGTQIQAATQFAPSVAAQYNSKLQQKLQESANQFRKDLQEDQQDFTAKQDAFKAGVQINLEQMKRTTRPGGIRGLQFLGSGKADPVVERDLLKKLDGFNNLTDILDKTEALIDTKGLSAWGPKSAQAEAFNFLIISEAGKSLIQAGVLQKTDLEFIKQGMSGEFSGFFANAFNPNHEAKIKARFKVIRDNVKTKMRDQLLIRNYGVEEGSSISKRLFGDDEAGRKGSPLSNKKAVTLSTPPANVSEYTASFDSWKKKHGEKILKRKDGAQMLDSLNTFEAVLADPSTTIEQKKEIRKILKETLNLDIGEIK